MTLAEVVVLYASAYVYSRQAEGGPYATGANWTLGASYGLRGEYTVVKGISSAGGGELAGVAAAGVDGGYSWCGDACYGLVG